MRVSFKNRPKLSQQQHDQIVLLDREGKNKAQIAKELGVSTWAVNRHLEAARSPPGIGPYEQKQVLIVDSSIKNYKYSNQTVVVHDYSEYQPPQIDAPWQRVEGYFWVYFNTRRGKGHLPRNATPKQMAWKDASWIIRVFKTRKDVLHLYPVVGTFEDIYAHEISIRPSERVGWKLGPADSLEMSVNSIQHLESVYLENPPWQNQRTSIQWVRGFLRMEGVLFWR